MEKHTWTVNGEGIYRSEREARSAAESLADEQNAVVVIERSDRAIEIEVSPKWQRDEIASQQAAEAARALGYYEDYEQEEFEIK